MKQSNDEYYKEALRIKTIMVSSGFSPICGEYWHFDYRGLSVEPTCPTSQVPQDAVVGKQVDYITAGGSLKNP